VNVGDPAAIASPVITRSELVLRYRWSSGRQRHHRAHRGVLINMVTRAAGTGSRARSSTRIKPENQWDNIDTTLQQSGVRPKGAAVDYIKISI